MTPLYATLLVPDARRLDGRRDTHTHEEVRALVRVIRRGARGPLGQAPTLPQLAELLGIAPSTLEAYGTAPRRDRSAAPRGVPYTVLYCLEAMAACPGGVAAALWPQEPPQ